MKRHSSEYKKTQSDDIKAAKKLAKEYEDGKTD